jgi:hypothetical protein
MKNVVCFFSCVKNLRNYRDALISDINKYEGYHPTLVQHTETTIHTMDTKFTLVVYKESYNGMRADEVKIDKTLQIKALDGIFPVVNSDMKKVTFINFEGGVLL